MTIAQLALAVTLAAADQRPQEPDPELVTPGFGGFLPVFALMLVLALLAWSITRHSRRAEARHRSRMETQQDSQQAAGAAAEGEPARSSADDADESAQVDGAGQADEPGGPDEAADTAAEGKIEEPAQDDEPTIDGERTEQP